MSGFLQKTAIALTAALATAVTTPAAAQEGTGDLSIRETCLALGQSPALKTFETGQRQKGKIGFAQNDRLGCKFEYAVDPSKPLLVETYNLADPRQATRFASEVRGAQRLQEKDAELKQFQEHLQKNIPSRRSGARDGAANPAPVGAEGSAGPGTKKEQLEDLRARRYKEAGIPLPKNQ